MLETFKTEHDARRFASGDSQTEARYVVHRDGGYVVSDGDHTYPGETKVATYFGGKEVA